MLSLIPRQHRCIWASCSCRDYYLSGSRSHMFHKLSLASLNLSVDSITRSIIKSFHGKVSMGLFQKITFILCPFITILIFSFASTTPSYLPNVESYLNKWARVLASVRSFIPQYYLQFEGIPYRPVPALRRNIYLFYQIR